MNNENLAQLMIATDLDQNAQLKIDKKLKMADRMLKANVIIQGLSLVYGVIAAIKLSVFFKNDAALASYDPLSLHLSVAYYPALLIVLSILSIRELKAQKLLGWGGSIVIFLMSLPTWGILVACIGLVALLDEPLRTRYLKELDL